MAVVLLAGITAFATGSSRSESEIDLLVGHTMKFYPAGTHLKRFTVEDGDEYIQASLTGHQLTLKGLKAGDATLRLELRAGKQAQLLVHVKSVSFIRTASKTEQPEKPEWTGTYRLRLPADHYSIIYHSFNEDGRERIRKSFSCIDGVYVEGECFESEDGCDGMEDIINIYDTNTSLGYSGGLRPDGHYRMYYADGDRIAPENEENARNWYDTYAPESLSEALLGIDPADFGRDNHGDDDLENGTIMQRIRMTGGNQSQLKRFYRGNETVCGRECWVFDFRGTNFFGYGGFCVWIDPETGLALRHEGEKGGGFIVTRFDLDYRVWDIQIRPDLFE